MSIHEITQFLVSSEDIVLKGGLILVLLIVYAENGLFFGFFLPGDYLLFAAGLFCGTDDFKVPISVLTSAILLAAILGSYTGYFFGKIVGKSFLQKDTFFVKRKHIIETRAYFIKYGGMTLLVGRFLPIVRTFGPIVAGIVDMEFKRFSLFNVLGGIIWACGLVLSGYFLGVQFPEVKQYIHYIIIGFIVVTSAVVLRSYWILRTKQKRKDERLKKVAP